MLVWVYLVSVSSPTFACKVTVSYRCSHRLLLFSHSSLLVKVEEMDVPSVAVEGPLHGLPFCLLSLCALLQGFELSYPVAGLAGSLFIPVQYPIPRFTLLPSSPFSFQAISICASFLGPYRLFLCLEFLKAKTNSLCLAKNSAFMDLSETHPLQM